MGISPHVAAARGAGRYQVHQTLNVVALVDAAVAGKPLVGRRQRRPRDPVCSAASAEAAEAGFGKKEAKGGTGDH